MSWTFISRLRGTATVFMSTHILNDVNGSATRIAILNFGHLGRGARSTSSLDPLCPADLRAPAGTAPARRGGPARGGDARPPWANVRPDHSGSVRVFVGDPRIAGPASCRWWLQAA